MFILCRLIFVKIKKIWLCMYTFPKNLNVCMFFLFVFLVHGLANCFTNCNLQGQSFHICYCGFPLPKFHVILYMLNVIFITLTNHYDAVVIIVLHQHDGCNVWTILFLVNKLCPDNIIERILVLMLAVSIQCPVDLLWNGTLNITTRFQYVLRSFTVSSCVKPYHCFNDAIYPL